MSQCGGCNMTLILFNNFKLSLSQQNQKIQKVVHPFDKVNQVQPNFVQQVPKLVQDNSSQFTNNGKFLKYTRK